MHIPEYDDYYCLDDYAARFVGNPEQVVDAYFSLISTINLLMTVEKRIGNDLASYAQFESIASEIAEGGLKSAKEVLLRCNPIGFFVENGKVVADVDIYNDFVAYLTMNGINV